MKNLKFIILVIPLLLLSGCTATYNLEITNTRFNENVIINMNKNEYNDFTSDENNKYANMYYDDTHNSGEEGVELPIPGVKYYDYTENASNNIVQFSGEFSYEDYNRSTMATRGFNSVKITGNDEELHMQTSTGFTFLYDGLTRANIRITSPYKVMNSNADSVDGNTLIWNITPSNADNKQIVVDYNRVVDPEENDTTDDNQEQNEGQDNIIDNGDNQTDDNQTENNSSISPTIVIIIISIIVIILLVVALILKHKKNSLNKL